MRAARVRVVEDPGLAGRGLVRHDGSDRLGHRAEVHRDVLGLRDHATVLVEERRRAVAPLLDVRRERGADEHRSHLLGDRAERRADDLQLDVDHATSAGRACRAQSVSPAQPAGIQAVAPSSSSTCWPVGAQRRASDVDAVAPVSRRRSVRRRARSRARDRRSRTAPRARRGTAPRAGLRAAPSARTTARRTAGPPRRRREARRPRRAERRTCARRRVARRRRRGRARTGLRRRRERERVVIPSSSASAHACSGPAPPKATSAKSRGSRPCSTETTRSARTISALTTSITPAGSISAERPLGRRDVELDSARQRRAAAVRAGGSRRSPSARVPPRP